MHHENRGACLPAADLILWWYLARSIFDIIWFICIYLLSLLFLLPLPKSVISYRFSDPSSCAFPWLSTTFHDWCCLRTSRQPRCVVFSPETVEQAQQVPSLPRSLESATLKSYAPLITPFRPFRPFRPFGPFGPFLHCPSISWEYQNWLALWVVRH